MNFHQLFLGEKVREGRLRASHLELSLLHQGLNANAIFDGETWPIPRGLNPSTDALAEKQKEIRGGGGGRGGRGGEGRGGKGGGGGIEGIGRIEGEGGKGG